MNLTTNHIEEVHKVSPYKADWTHKFPAKSFVKVELTANSHGSVQKHHRIWEAEEWQKIKKQGYYVE